MKRTYAALRGVLLVLSCLVVVSSAQAAPGEPGAGTSFYYGGEAFAINEGAESTTDLEVTLDLPYDIWGSEYRVSERDDFSDAVWQPYIDPPLYRFSFGNGLRTLYMQVRTDSIESPVMSDSIVLDVPETIEIVNFSLNGDADCTLYHTIVLCYELNTSATAYRMSESPNFEDTGWVPLDAETEFYGLGRKVYRFAPPNGMRTLYFQVRNELGTSAVVSDSIRLSMGAPNSVYFYIPCENYDGVVRTLDVDVYTFCFGFPTDYRISESPTFEGAEWLPFGYTDETGQDYECLIPYRFSPGNGIRTLYFQMRNEFAESPVEHWTMALDVPDGSTVPPDVTLFTLNNGNPTSLSSTVTCNFQCSGNPTEYRVSKDSTFAGVWWQLFPGAEDEPLRYELAERGAVGTQTLYFQVRNSAGTSPVYSDSIALTPLLTFAINNGAATTSDFTVTLNNTCMGEATEYRVTRSHPEYYPDEVAPWLPYSEAPEVTLFRASPRETLYFQVRGPGGESDIFSDTIAVAPAPPTGSIALAPIPEETLGARALWSIDGILPPYAGSGTVEVTAGLHRLAFSLDGASPPYAPNDRVVFVAPGQRSDITATYVDTAQPGTLVVQAPSLEVTPGQLLLVPVSIVSNRSGAKAVSGDVTWDPNALELVNAQGGPAQSACDGDNTRLVLSLSGTPGKMSYVWELARPSSKLPDGEVLWLSFRVAEGCPVPSISAISGTCSATRYDGYDYFPVPSSFVEGTITISNEPPLNAKVHALLEPVEAVTAGAQWRVDGGEWHNSGDTLDLAAGSYSVEFKTVEGWVMPVARPVTIVSGETAEVTGAYTLSTGSLSVSLLPQAAAAEGALWSVDGGAWVGSGTTIDGLAPGAHTVAFAEVPGWTTPAAIPVTVVPGETATASATYIDALPPTVTISGPSVALTRNGPVTYTVTYSGADAVTLTDAYVQLIPTGSATGVVTVSGSGFATRTVTIDTIAGDGTLGIAIGAGTATDNAANQAAATEASATFTVDNTGPVFSNLRIDSNPAREGTPVILTFGAGGAPAADPVVTVNGHAAVKIDSKGGVGYTYQYTVQSADPDGAATICVTGYDAAGNVGEITNTSALVVDKTAPNPPQATNAALTNHRRPTWTWTSGGGGNGVYRIKLDDADLAANYAEATSASFTPDMDLVDGTHTLYVQELDAAGNPSPTAAFSTEVDTTPPELILLGDEAATAEFGLPYTDAGATATDTRDGNLTGAIQVTGLPVDTMDLGSVAVRYTVADEAGNAAPEKTRTVTVVDTTAPMAVIATQPAPVYGVAPLSVDFDGSGSTDLAGVTAYEWDFDASDGFQPEATGATANRVFLDGGHTVTLRVTDAHGLSAEATVYVAVNRPPVITAVNATPRSGTAPLVAAFEAEAYDPDGGQLTYSWDFNGDGIPDSALQNPIYTYPAETPPGTYTAALRVTEPEGVVATAFLPMTITEHAPVVDELATPEDGCSLTTPEGISIDVPPGAVSQDTVIAASPVTGPSFSVEDRTVFFRLELGPAGASFSQPIRITVPLSAQLQSAQGVTVRYFDETTGDWTSEGIGNVQIITTDDGPMLQFETTHFSEYGIVGPLGSDINLDGQVDAVDLQLVINGALGKSIGVLNANVDGTGKITAADVQQVINDALSGR